MFKGNEIRIVKISLQGHAHHSRFHNNHDVETTRVSSTAESIEKWDLQAIITHSVVEREYENGLLCQKLVMNINQLIKIYLVDIINYSILFSTDFRF